MSKFLLQVDDAYTASGVTILGTVIISEETERALALEGVNTIHISGGVMQRIHEENPTNGE
jgi:hypothetical protein